MVKRQKVIEEEKNSQGLRLRNRRVHDTRPDIAPKVSWLWNPGM